MNSKVLFVFAILVAAVCANPAANTEWRWIPRHPTKTPNIMGVPFKNVINSIPKKFDGAPGFKAVPGCGIVGGFDSAIVGGTEAVPHSFPWMAALFIDNMYFCGGSLIDSEWVLTAAHCTQGANSVEVVLGAHNIQQNEPTQVSIVSTEHYEHPNWAPVLIQNDVALIHLPTPVTFDANITPVCLPGFSDAQLPVGTQVTPSGWGRDSDASPGISPVLRQVTDPVISVDDCRNIYGATIIDSIICIDTTGGKGTCNGDSGGPLNLANGAVTTTRGITSFGASAGCEAGFPAGFTRVIDFLDWIGSTSGIAIDP